MSDLTKHPSFLSAASQLLEAPKLRLFASRSRLNLSKKNNDDDRILCKLPGESIEIPWHQDSNYWPLEPMKVTIQGKRPEMLNYLFYCLLIQSSSYILHWFCEICQQVTSLWLALDDVTAENGAMDMFPFSTLPKVPFSCTGSELFL